MATTDERIRDAIAEQASEWFVANDEAPLDSSRSAALIDWLRASPVHVEEFLGVAAITRDLRTAGTDAEYSIEALLARALAEDDDSVHSSWPRSHWPAVFAAVRDAPLRRWRSVAITVAAVSVVGLGLLSLSKLQPGARMSAPAAAAALHFETRHGDQQTYRLADNSVLHLNTDSAVEVRYSPTQRLVVLLSGEADFEVAHEPKRAFRVLAGPAEVVDLGTKFDVRLRQDSTLVTVLEGRVAVEPASLPMKGTPGSSENHPPRFVELVANQQISVAKGQWPGAPMAADAQRATAWLHRQIAFDHEPLERVAAELNRYSPKPIEIMTPRLRTLEISGVFSTDDIDEFLAFLRSLQGVRVEVTATHILVSQK
jgi:transmembrane sensor